MNVALCISGFARKMDQSYPYLKKYILDELDPDVFYFGYYDEKDTKENILETYKPVSHFIRESDQAVDDEITQAYSECHPRAGGGELFHHVTKHNSAIPMLSQFYNMARCNELKKEKEQEENFKYDVVIRVRSDYFFFRSIKEDLELSKDYVCSTDHWDWLDGYTDSFAFGNSEDMDIYSSFFNYFAEYVLDDGIQFHPETMLKHHFGKQRIQRKVIPPCWWWNLEDFSTIPYIAPTTHREKPESIFPWKDCSESLI